MFHEEEISNVCEAWMREKTSQATDLFPSSRNLSDLTVEHPLAHHIANRLEPLIAYNHILR